MRAGLLKTFDRVTLNVSISLGIQHLRGKDYYFFLHKEYFLKIIFSAWLKVNINLGKLTLAERLYIEVKFYLCPWFKVCKFILGRVASSPFHLQSEALCHGS